MSAIDIQTGARGCRRWSHGLAALAFAWGGSALAQEVVAVPAAHLNHAEGSVAYAPQGDKEWHDVQPRRVLKRGDRLWTDRGSRAEVQAGGHALRLNSETQLVLENVTPNATQLSLTQGSVVATVTHMTGGDSFELGTPNLAFRARQPGDYRIDVDTKQGLTRVVVLAGTAAVYGEKGEALEIRAGQRATFKARDLERVQTPAFAATDEFDRWSGARRRGEPTVSMPAVASAPAAAIPRGLVTKGQDIVIPGGPMQPVAKATPIPSAVPAAKPTATTVAAVTPAPVSKVLAPMTPAAPATPAPVAAAPMRINAPMSAAPVQAAPVTALPSQAQLQAQARAAAEAKAAAEIKAQAEIKAAAEAKALAEARAAIAAKAQAQAAREQQERQRVAQHRAEQQRHAAARAEQERRVAAAEAKRVEDRRHAVAMKRAEEDRRHAQSKRDQESKRLAAAKRAEEERRHAQAKKAAEDKRLAAKRAAEAQKIAEARRVQLARLQDQARREEQNVQARREQSRRAEDDRREEQLRREDAARREELARREEDLRRQRAYADQARRDQERREQEVWLRQQQQLPPARPVPMGVPIRRVS